MKKVLFTIFSIFISCIFSGFAGAECVGVSLTDSPETTAQNPKLLLHSPTPNADNFYSYVSCGYTVDSFLDCNINTISIGADGYAHKCTANGWEKINFDDIRNCVNIEELASFYDAASNTVSAAKTHNLSYVLVANLEKYHKSKGICKYKLSDYLTEEDNCEIRGGKFMSYYTACDTEEATTQNVHITDSDNNTINDVAITITSLNTPIKLNIQQDSNGDYPITIAGGVSGLKFEFSKSGYITKVVEGRPLIKNPNVTLLNETNTIEKNNTDNPISSSPQGNNNETNYTNTEKDSGTNENPDISDKLKSAQDALTKAKEAENSWANRAVTAASTAATGLGAMTAASAIAEQRADADAEKQMRAYIETMKCEYGNGQNVKLGNEEITLPGGNELLDYYTEYKQLADNLKTTKSALGLRSGIESEVLYDRAQSGLYQYASVGKTGGGETSLYRALTDKESEDAAAWTEQKEKNAKQLKTGAIVAGAGVATGLVGNYLVNGRGNKTEELKREFQQVEKETELEFPLFILTISDTKRSTQQNREKLATIDAKPITQVSGVKNNLGTELSKLNFVTDNATFESGEYTLKNSAALDEWARKISYILLQDEYKDSKICLTAEGNTDRTTPAKKSGRDYTTNEQLSQKRADAVINHLKEKSPLKSFISQTYSYGYGEEKCTEQEHKKDDPNCRYVSVTITDCTTELSQKMAPIMGSLIGNIDFNGLNSEQ